MYLPTTVARIMLADLADSADKSARLAESPVLAYLADLALLAEGGTILFSGLEISGFECLALYHLAALNLS